MELRQRLTDVARALPLAHRVGIIATLVALAMLSVLFVRWLTTPSYTVLYSGMDDAAVAEAIAELETQGVPYRLEGGGRTVLVPREQLYTTRAAMAGAGFAAAPVPAGFELLAEQGVGVTDFRQRVDYQRALQGEIARTLMAMEAVQQATVTLVMPERELFSERREPATASVLLSTTRPLDDREVETVAFLVASSVEGLTLEQVTIADTTGTVLHAPGDTGGASVATSRNLRQTRAFEEALAGDVATLLAQFGGPPPAVVVRATLNFDERQTETEDFADGPGAVLSEQTAAESFEGTEPAPGGVVGLDGGPIEGEAGESAYDRDEALREFGVDRTTVRTVAAPGRVERLSVAIVMDDGSVTGAAPPPVDEVERLVTAALGLQEQRGDTVAVTPAAFPVAEEPPAPEPPPADLADRGPQIASAVVLLLVALVLVAMTVRRQRPRVRTVDIEVSPVHREGDAAQEPRELEVPAEQPPDPAAVLRDQVTELVQRQPEEIATLLRSWLADRKA